MGELLVKGYFHLIEIPGQWVMRSLVFREDTKQ